MNQRYKHAIVVGFDYYGKRLARLINEHSATWRLRYYGGSRLQAIAALIAARAADAIVCIGGPGPNAALCEAARRANIPVIVVWVGTDVLNASQTPHLLELIKSYEFTNLSDGPWLVDELARLGITARYVPFTAVEVPATLTPLPKRFAVLTHLPEPRRAFYGEKTVYAVARALPDVTFSVVGRGEPNSAAPPNVHFLGYIKDMGACIDAHSAILRMPEHDGKSTLVLEALARGRHVVWNYQFPAVMHASGLKDAIAAVAQLRDAHASGKLALNGKGFREVAPQFSPTLLADQFERELDEAAARMIVREKPQRRVAISGLNLFCAQVIAQLRRSDFHWGSAPIRTAARLEVLTAMITMLGSDLWYSIGAPTEDRWLHLLALLLRKPRVIHWVGADIAVLQTDRRLRAFCRLPGVVNLAEVDWTIDRLRSFSIRATLAPLPPRIPPVELPPMPKEFTVLVYVPRSREDFYGRREYERLFRAFIDKPVRFLVVGGAEVYAPPGARVERLGWCNDLSDAFARSSILVRMTRDDGLSVMVLEALTRGRYVAWTKEFPFTERVRTYADAQAQIERLLALHEAGALEPRADAANYVAQTYDPNRCIATIVQAWESALGSDVARTIVAPQV